MTDASTGRTEEKPDQAPDTGASSAPHGKEENESPQQAADDRARSRTEEPAARWVPPLVFGAIFGFLLQKGGVAKFDILVGVLLLEKFTVIKVMLSAIIVGMIGTHLLNRKGEHEPQIKETVLGSNIPGGLIFGIGFALIAYCPGTNAAAVGQGNLDALIGIAGMMLGSYLFALSSSFIGKTAGSWGRKGKIRIPDVAGLSPGVFVAIAAPALVVVLLLLEIFAGAR